CPAFWVIPIDNPGATTLNVEVCGQTQVACQALFTAEIENLGQSGVNFFDMSTSSTPIVSHFWDFGDGTTSSETNPIHFFNNDGEYLVTLTTISQDSCFSTFQQFISVGDIVMTDCYASFDYFQTTSQAPFQVLFQDYSDSFNGEITSHLWNFGDGTTSTETNPSHAFANIGSYNVTLTITSDSCTNTITNQIFVQNTPIDSTCNADFIYWQLFQSTDAEFAIATCSSIPVVSYLWTFGDGTSSTEASPIHHYNQSGQYVATLTITNLAGCTSVYTLTVDIIDYENYCNASFWAWQSDNAGLTFQFVNESEANTDTPTYNWDFGDGSFSTEAFPTHTYSTPGIYTVSLVVIGLDSCFSSYTTELWVGENWIDSLSCYSVFYYGNADPSNPNIIQFYTYNSSPNDSYTYTWDFGDGSVGVGANPVHIYDSTGVYFVTMTYTSNDNTNCSGSYVSEIYLGTTIDPWGGWNGGSCVANFVASPVVNPTVPPVANYMMQFTDLSYGNINTWHWDFGDGTSSSEQNPTHIYQNQGYYTVTLSTMGDLCQNSFSMYIWVGNVIDYPGSCQASFFPIQNDSISSNAFIFVDFSSSNSQILTWEWHFGDGTASYEQYPLHTYQNNGVYEVSLTISTADSCSSTYVMTIDMINGLLRGNNTEGLNIVSNNDVENLAVLRMNPNPITTNGVLEIVSPNLTKAKYQLYDNTGKLIESKSLDLLENVNRVELNTEALTSGIYYINVSSDKWQKTLKLVKI
ncbi:MAG: PKD domain-containing protein, partial [Saprospiraceae bacterium]|nr:PKD domain-containing protein [Saprospiraceae bacterium]